MCMYICMQSLIYVCFASTTCFRYTQAVSICQSSVCKHLFKKITFLYSKCKKIQSYKIDESFSYNTGESFSYNTDESFSYNTDESFSYSADENFCKGQTA